MAEVEVCIEAVHQVKIDEVEIEFRGRGRGSVTSRTVNFVVCCLTCGWEHPSRFRARKAAEVTALEHGDDVGDRGFLSVLVSPTRRSVTASPEGDPPVSLWRPGQR